MNITVIGCGRWGSFIAWYLDKIGHTVFLYGRRESARMRALLETRSNGLVTMPETLTLTTDLCAAADSDIIVISVHSQGLRALMRELAPLNLQNKIFVLCMKGIEIETGMRLSEVCAAECDRSNRVAVWVGPGHVQEFAAGVPNCMVIDSDDEDAKRTLVESFSSELIRFYYGQDLIGSEIGAAAKNVIGIAAGMLDGLGLSTLKGALMARGTREIARLIDALGGSELSAYGLCHLGDYEATLFSPYSHNRMFGEKFVRQEPFDALAEGYYAVDALLRLGKTVGVDLPICSAVYNVLYRNEDPQDALNTLFTRSIKNEF
ncbi:MAG: NAD(P)H-dependent glycerol-3-phosphate dehydrogenase [Ruminococcus bromii]|nr:NAD(P)H-dependent glycerol-3-phosphate dehydrogenase [Ruminococcus bromii]